MPHVIVDIHAHFTPPEWIRIMRREGAQHGCQNKEDASGA